ncbi:MAG TPA: hypothetical protein VFY01_02210, partial [Rheinheimera sp.]|nr:hypothetical protein [Rheinheimera sp.]
KRVLHYLAASVAPQYPLTTHYLFAQQQYPAACWQTALTEVFNNGLMLLQQSGELTQILQQYNLSNAIGTE